MVERDLQNIAIDYSDSSPDVNENRILDADEELLEILLKDRTTKRNILWMTDSYESRGASYSANSEILLEDITGKNGNVIKPRINKNKKEQIYRSRDKAEVFTPSWVCNKQNNLIDEAWFGYSSVFNSEEESEWKSMEEKIYFPEGKSWEDYILLKKLEVSCGEGPYIVSRYDTTTGQMLAVKERVGFLDRKLRVICENVSNREEWKKWIIRAYQSSYGYEWQGDSLLLARENLILTLFDYYKEFFGEIEPARDFVLEVANIISWNIWQMDGLRYVVPCSCHREKHIEADLFSEVEVITECEGCKKNRIDKHNGIYCNIMDWDNFEEVQALKLLGGD